MSAEELEPTVWPIRRLGSSVVHNVDPMGLEVFSARAFGAAFYGITSPAVAVCGAILRDGPTGALVWMREPDAATCRVCRRFTELAGFARWGAPVEGTLEALAEAGGFDVAWRSEAP